ncbi:unnamed protein product [Rotaria sp. Silwood2]|nr:unnamed protein product [Rotaria sp. Silwood2]CAF3244134.1 unnamed protein product [Rotaria sp. Silwood2]CAF3370787.1 unnamed protein product [Rotaria sp. Silwood2]CAF4194323.1 unnamed protein product [Rotaria sp. Silwood2]
MMSTKLIEGKSYEFNGLSIRTVDPAYKKLPHDYQLITTKTSKVREIIVPFEYQLIYNFTHLRHLETLPLHSIIGSYSLMKINFKKLIINIMNHLKHVKIDWFNGSRTLISMPNTRVTVV